MSAQLIAQFVFICIATQIPLLVCQCQQNVNLCFDKLATDLDNQKKLNKSEDQLNHVCNPTNGLFTQFVNCVKVTESVCNSDTNFRNYLCETRKLKMKITRFTWKASFFYYLCQNTVPDLSQDFFKHEECISSVLNGRKWKCDVNYDKPIKSMKDWKSNLNTTCSLWRKFRDCNKNDVKWKCGTQASVVADHLFHGHQSYFEKYNACGLEDLPGGCVRHPCWYDTISGKAVSGVTSATHPTSDVTDNKSLDSVNDNNGSTQSTDIGPNAETSAEHLPNEEESHPESDKESLTTVTESLSQVPKETTPVPNTDTVDNTEHLISSSAVSMYDWAGDRYLLVVPVVLVLFVKTLTN